MEGTTLTGLGKLSLSYNQISSIGPLANLTNLTYLVLNNNLVVDIRPLSNLTEVSSMWLINNHIEDVCPLVQNIGLGTGDVVYLSGNPLSAPGSAGCIVDLEARGVVVYP